MADNTSQSRLVLMCGLPGSGKTTLARELATSLPAVRFSPDEWLADLELDRLDESLRDRLEQRHWRMAQELLALGQNVILENGFWSRAERDTLRRGARELGAAVELRYLDVPFRERARRVGIRNGTAEWAGATLTVEMLAEWDTLFEAPRPDELALFDPPQQD